LRLGGDSHGAAAVNVGVPGARTSVVSVKGAAMGEAEQDEELTDEELDEQNGEPLPERTQTSVIGLPPGYELPIMPPDVSDV
jgi:hypothetical protein